MPRGWVGVQAGVGSIIQVSSVSGLTLGGNRLTVGTCHLNAASLAS